MPGFIVPMTIPRQPVSSLYRPRRDFVCTAGDYFQIALTIYDEDISTGAPEDITGATLMFTLMEDVTRNILSETAGEIAVAASGTATIAIPATVTEGLAGRYLWTVELNFDNGIVVSAGGVLNVTGAGQAMRSSSGGGSSDTSDLFSAPSYDDDAAAAAGGVALGELYRNGNYIMIRLT